MMEFLISSELNESDSDLVRYDTHFNDGRGCVMLLFHAELVERRVI